MEENISNFVEGKITLSAKLILRYSVTTILAFSNAILGVCALLLEVRTEQNTLDLELFQIT
jgi:hypothetical protein